MEWTFMLMLIRDAPGQQNHSSCESKKTFGGGKWEADALQPKRNRKKHSFGRAGAEITRQSRHCSTGTNGSYSGLPDVFWETPKTRKKLCRMGFLQRTATCGAWSGATICLPS